ncbi:peptidase M15A [Oscillatoria sp. FACHB-1407]|uniref:D-Ala-D-Ala carboxypeptidase family metallohydrolase n=1 Tax=Oscillatoria sp. FACHB-1407 TaxID=2692847 RepID=UPI001682B742|nr:D-Ala-D-Ala carboxypeptidase family metallohydrolase [Oscillatoria sp. FACHB-1407]MBD2462052.1 peptidase M15A [Oscillatoria sp. FACHB-1407]
MAELTVEQRNHYYLLEATRTGIHKPILAALYVAHYSPTLTDGEVGLGIAPINRIPPDQVNTFPEQVQYAANTIRSITNRLTAQGWEGGELWNVEQGRYSDRFIKEVADGYTPPANDPTAALLEASDYETLLHSYLEEVAVDHDMSQLPEDLAFLDPMLLEFIEQIPRYYQNLPYQRTALLEAARLWRKLDTREEAIAAFNISGSSSATGVLADESFLDPALLQFIQTVPPYYAGYPHQREALLRLVQLWRQVDSREDAIALLQSQDPDQTEKPLDSALIAFVQRLPQSYQGKGEQRNALTETFRLWQGLGSRATVLTELGINPQMLAGANPDRTVIENAARQLDRALLEFIKRVPSTYQETEAQREALIRLVQLWRGLPGRESAIQSLLDDLRRMERARRDSPDAPPPPQPVALPPRPQQWTPTNIQLYASIIPNGNFTWAEATHGGSRMPPNQATVDAIVRIAQLAQQARDRLGRPFRVTSWYRPPDLSQRIEGISQSRHGVGDAIDFYCDGLTGNQVYWALDPWWTGGLGRYQKFPNLIHLDARNYRARWTH